MTIVYISRHSQPFRKFLGEYKVNEIEQIRNEKNLLSVDGEKYAEQMSNLPELLKVEIFILFALCKSYVNS
ncbi:unknown [Clostridium sp. CAG:710]|nr:unknown [Clostridium sp. CAG:710]